MILRKFEAADGETILSWIKNEREFRMWSADRFGDYPSAPEKIASHHEMCSQSGGFYPMTAVDEYGNVVGHMILRYTDNTKSEVRFGFVIVDSSKRGKGLGRTMLELAKRFAADELYAKRISLGVFENNPAAFKCYKSVGFTECTGEGEIFEVLGERWKCIEMTIDM